MSKCPLCNVETAPKAAASNPTAARQPVGFLRRLWRSTQWLFPATMLALIPKCPLCVAAYVALFTCIGISVSTARWIQILMLALCLASLAYFAVRYCRETRRGRESGNDLGGLRSPLFSLQKSPESGDGGSLR
jgi:hypothetical protein